MNLALLAPKTSLLSKIFYQKTMFRTDQIEEKEILKSDHCLLTRGRTTNARVLQNNAFASTEV